MFQAYQFAGQSPDLLSLLWSSMTLFLLRPLQSVPFLLRLLSPQSFCLSFPRFLQGPTHDGSDDKLLFPNIDPTIEVKGYTFLAMGIF